MQRRNIGSNAIANKWKLRILYICIYIRVYVCITSTNNHHTNTHTHILNIHKCLWRSWVFCVLIAHNSKTNMVLLCKLCANISSEHFRVSPAGAAAQFRFTYIRTHQRCDASNASQNVIVDGHSMPQQSKCPFDRHWYTEPNSIIFNSIQFSIRNPLETRWSQKILSNIHSVFDVLFPPATNWT